ncbi:MAG TPA: glycosyltransferase [Acidimicrobiia bacterium]|nr:glycosyltransferase [Acidimicrobiia bacterium]
MRVALLSEGRIEQDPRARALAWSLRHVGHEVIAVDSTGAATWADTALGVASRVPSGFGSLGSLARRAQPPIIRRWLHRRRLAAATRKARPDLVYPLSPDLVATADRAAGRGAVVRPPGWTPAFRDITRLAPTDHRFSTSPAGPGVAHHLEVDTSPRGIPSPGRHAGRRVALVHRHTPTTPARYLTSALERAGVEVVARGVEFDFAEADDLDAVIIVESPFPPPRLIGERSSVPVLFWVHHGEHHLGANLRLVDRLRPDAVLLAHSWHLAHRFPVPVHRFPFGVPVELFPTAPKPWAERTFDVAMVGAGMFKEGSRYDVRRDLVARLQAGLGERAMFPQRVPPEELASIYADTRIVINDGGRRHHPITMRLFETAGAGSLMLTEDQPGTDVLFSRSHYRVLQPEAAFEQVTTLAEDPEAEAAAEAAHRHALAHHTYDQRVDELMDIIAVTRPAGWVGRPRAGSALARLADEDVDVDTVVTDDPRLAEQLPDRIVWDIDSIADRMSDGGRVDAAALTRADPRLDMVVAGTRRYLYADHAIAEQVAQAVTRHHPDASFSHHGDLLRADTGTLERYRFAGQEGK